MASLLLGVSALLLMIFPELAKVVSVVIYGVPIFFQLTMGFWLLLSGLPPFGVAQIAKA